MRATLLANFILLSCAFGFNAVAADLTPSNPDLANAAYVKLGSMDFGDAWEQRASGAPPSVRVYHTAVWTGSEMIVWGGTTDATSSGLTYEGTRYNPAANSWTPVTSVGTPYQRFLHTAVWTGKE